MKSAVKRIANELLSDELFARLISKRSRNYQRRFLRDNGLDEISRKMLAHFGSSVLNGPFRGMKYPGDSITARHAAPKLLGSFETELHPIIHEAVGNAGQYES